MNVVHGGNIYELSARAGCFPDDILDFSASINLSVLLPAWPYSFRLLSPSRKLPDIHNKLLIEAISKFHDIDPECIAVGTARLN